VVRVFISTIFLENLKQVLTDHLGIPTLNVMAFHKVNKLTIFEQRNRRRRGGIGQCKFPGLCHSFFVDASKNRC
jgi:hypothetical protein